MPVSVDSGCYREWGTRARGGGSAPADRSDGRPSVVVAPVTGTAVSGRDNGTDSGYRAIRFADAAVAGARITARLRDR